MIVMFAVMRVLLLSSHLQSRVKEKFELPFAGKYSNITTAIIHCRGYMCFHVRKHSYWMRYCLEVSLSDINTYVHT